GESLLLGVVGTLVGIGMGVLLAFIGTSLVGRAFDVQLPRLVEVMTPWPFIQGGVFGISMAIVGAIVPSIIAWFVSPLEGMNRVVKQRSWNFTWTFAGVGSVLTVGSLALIYGSITGRFPIKSATYCGVTLLIGLVMLDTLMLDPQASAVARLLHWFFRVE